MLSGPWVIMPKYGQIVESIIVKHLSGEKNTNAFLNDIRDKKEPAQRVQAGQNVAGPSKRYDVFNKNTAILYVNGIIAPKINLLDDLSGPGGTSAQLLMDDFIEIRNSGFENCLLRVNSPGGNVELIKELAGTIFDARRNMNIIAFVEGKAASGAQWIVGAAHKTYISSETVITGSVGVYITHVDKTEKNKKEGLNIEDIAAGEYKIMDSSNQPLTSKGREYIQAQAEKINTVFASDLSKMRNIPMDNIFETVANGKLFIGDEGIGVGLVDGIMSWEALLYKVETNGFNFNSSNKIYSASNLKQKGGIEVEINTAMILEKHPEIATHFKGEGVKEGYKEGFDVGHSAGVKVERDRQVSLSGLFKRPTDKRDNIIMEARKGSAGKGDVAVKLLEYMGTQQAETLKSMAENDATGLESYPDNSGNDDAPMDFMTLVEAYKEERKCKTNVAMVEISKSHPAAHRKFLGLGKE